MRYLEQPIAIGTLSCHNRLVMPPMATAKATPEGQVSQALCQYYEQRTQGGHIGLLITEHSYICQQGQASSGQVSIAKEDDIEGLRQLVECIAHNGVKVIAQINHAGSKADPHCTGGVLLGPSAVKHPLPKVDNDLIPRALTKAEIRDIVELFAQAALRAKTAGYDGVEIHAAHGYLLNQFYSPIMNQRTDEYGADCIENRVRLHLEVIAAVRAVVGAEYPVALRFGGCDYAAGGSTIADSVAASKLFAQAGIDLLDITGGMFGYVVEGRKQAGYFSDMTQQIKQHVHIPVLLTGGVETAQQAEELLQAHAADLIGVGRALFKDAQWAAKAMETGA